VVARHGLEDPDFNPTIAEVIAELERDPKQFEKKFGKLAGIRAAPLRYRNAPWRMPFLIDERTRIVTVITIDKHDAAYRAASR
jgi:mRNA-degrading endonuclease RelE of RelBE toxin-antitoxin system